MDYTRQLSQMVSPALFGHMGMPMGHNHPHGHRGKRGNFRHHHHEEANVQRSALLEEFRSDKSKTWELKVSQIVYSVRIRPDLNLLITEPDRSHCRVQQRSTWLQIYSDTT